MHYTAPALTTHEAVQLNKVSRRFGAVLAVDSASVKFEHGRIHAIVGENGAGKSTLLSLVGGNYPPNDGHVIINGAPLSPATPAEAIRRGIGFVHQHFMLVEAFTALENIILGVEPTDKFQILDLHAGRDRAQRVLDELEMSLNLDAPVAQLGVGERQNLEIVRVLSRGAKIILLDEPTAVLTPDQSVRLFETLRRTANKDACVVVVTHRLNEVLDHCDHVTVMRKGRTVRSDLTSNVTAYQLTCDIMGQEPLPAITRPELPETTSVSLEIKGLCVARADGQPNAIDQLDLTVTKGQIVGIAGVEGNGQQELIGALSGLLPVQQGQILLDGTDITKKTVKQRRRNGLSIVHADRQKEGLMLDVSVWDNLVLGDLDDIQNEAQVVDRRMNAYGIVPANPKMHVAMLSGGNRQKVVVARALDRTVRAVVLAQPTRGVDLGAARSIHEAICDAAKSGAAVLVISADLAELRAICHQIAVLVRGKIAALLPPDTSEVTFGHAMLGRSIEFDSSRGSQPDSIPPHPTDKTTAPQQQLTPDTAPDTTQATANKTGHASGQKAAQAQTTQQVEP